MLQNNCFWLFLARGLAHEDSSAVPEGESQKLQVFIWAALKRVAVKITRFAAFQPN